MRKKRGVSPLIAAVLLVGFSVALAAIVSQFVIKETKKFGPEQFLEDSPFCENIVVEVARLPPATDSPTVVPDVKITGLGGTTFNLEGLGVKNKGSFAVKRLVLRSGGKEVPVILTADEGKPGSVINVKSSSNKPGLIFYKNSEQKIVIQPAVYDHEKEKVLPCPKQEISVSYKELYCKLKSGTDTPPTDVEFTCP